MIGLLEQNAWCRGGKRGSCATIWTEVGGNQPDALLDLPIHFATLDFVKKIRRAFGPERVRQ